MILILFSLSMMFMPPLFIDAIFLCFLFSSSSFDAAFLIYLFISLSLMLSPFSATFHFLRLFLRLPVLSLPMFCFRFIFLIIFRLFAILHY